MTIDVADQPLSANTPFEIPREFFGQRFVYTVISPRAEGLSIGVSLNADKRCNFDCAYCEVDKSHVHTDEELDLDTLQTELEQTIRNVQSKGLREHPLYRRLPDELLVLKHVALSGDGEPTLSNRFNEITEAVMQVRACQKQFFKVVLITNGSALDRTEIQDSLSLFTSRDEIWVKLDAGTEEYTRKVNGNSVGLRKVLSNILTLARKRPVIIQSLFAALDGEPPSQAELNAYCDRLAELKKAGAQIQLVQVYSATRPQRHRRCSHLSLKELNAIAKQIRTSTGLNAKVF